MISREEKVERLIPEGDLPQFFRELADQMEAKGKPNWAASVLLQDFTKLKISIKEEYGQYQVKVKCKALVDETVKPRDSAAISRGKPGYSELKKRMKRSFKVLFTMIHDGKIPPQSAMENFLADAELMIDYPGYGDEYYDEFRHACRDFAAAYQTGNPARLHEAWDRLDQIKSHCHNRFK
ncbi:MAG: GAK system XXXCH domain-containing protein [Desulfovibrionales bacterium]